MVDRARAVRSLRGALPRAVVGGVAWALGLVVVAQLVDGAALPPWFTVVSALAFALVSLVGGAVVDYTERGR